MPDGRRISIESTKIHQKKRLQLDDGVSNIMNLTHYHYPRHLFCGTGNISDAKVEKLEHTEELQSCLHIIDPNQQDCGEEGSASYWSPFRHNAAGVAK